MQVLDEQRLWGAVYRILQAVQEPMLLQMGVRHEQTFGKCAGELIRSEVLKNLNAAGSVMAVDGPELGVLRLANLDDCLTVGETDFSA